MHKICRENRHLLFFRMPLARRYRSCVVEGGHFHHGGFFFGDSVISSLASSHCLLSELVEQLLGVVSPSGLMAEVISEESTTEEVTSPAEDERISRFKHDKRKRHFRMGREGLKRLLHRIDDKRWSKFSEINIDSDSQGAPVLPAEVCGSVSHKESFAVAVMAPSGKQIRRVGVDLESLQCEKDRDLDKQKRLEKLIASPDEFELVRQSLVGLWNNPSDSVPFTLLFCMKEAAYKAFIGPSTGLRSISLTELLRPCGQVEMQPDHNNVHSFILRTELKGVDRLVGRTSEVWVGVLESFGV